MFKKSQRVPPFTFFNPMRLTGDLFKRIRKKFGKMFSSIFSFLRAFVVSSCRKSGFRVLLSLRYGADLGRSLLVLNWNKLMFDLICLFPLSHFIYRQYLYNEDYSVAFLFPNNRILLVFVFLAAFCNSLQKIPFYLLFFDLSVNSVQRLSFSGTEENTLTL